MLTFAERLARRTVRDENGCLIFTGARNRKGYGYISFQGKPWQAHRAAWTHLLGQIPEGMQIDHLCRVTSCVNVQHMEVVTPLVNRHRRADYERQTCPQGHAYDERYSNGARRRGTCRRASAARGRARMKALGLKRVR